MTENSVSNRLHRSGAIDFNVEYNLRQSRLQQCKASTEKNGKREFEDFTKDSYSICEGEPLFTVKRSKASSLNHCARSSRRAMPVLSSLNGTTIITPALVSQLEVLRDAYTSNNDGTLSQQIYNAIRNSFFKSINPTGVSVTKWAADMAGKQGEMLVATMGGLNTIYTDEDVFAGETLIVDIPDFPLVEKFINETTHDAPWRFIEWQHKRGVPKQKKTLVVRSMPQLPSCCDFSKAKRFTDEFQRRGQVLGKCVKGARAGERCDIVLGSNAVGVWSI